MCVYNGGDLRLNCVESCLNYFLSSNNVYLLFIQEWDFGFSLPNGISLRNINLQAVKGLFDLAKEHYGLEIAENKQDHMSNIFENGEEFAIIVQADLFDCYWTREKKTIHASHYFIVEKTKDRCYIVDPYFHGRYKIDNEKSFEMLPIIRMFNVSVDNLVIGNKFSKVDYFHYLNNHYPQYINMFSDIRKLAKHLEVVLDTVKEQDLRMIKYNKTIRIINELLMSRIKVSYVLKNIYPEFEDSIKKIVIKWKKIKEGVLKYAVRPEKHYFYLIKKTVNEIADLEEQMYLDLLKQ